MTTTPTPQTDFVSVLDDLVPRWAPSPGPADEPPARPGGLGYLPGLDGLRALSAAAVVAYHLDFSWSAGGYLGVEVFFVLSGFLITRLMLDEQARTGTLDRARFWARRARRLLPAVIVLVVGVCLWGAYVLPAGDLASFRGDALASLFYVQNWHAIIADQPYFESFGRPSPLRHLWSLAIEEQFYLLWPLVLPAVLRRMGRRRTIALILGAVIASAGLMALTADITAPERAYYGTDTRAFGILLGGLLAFWWIPEQARATVVRPARWTIDALGLGALGMLLWQFVGRSEFDPWTYPQGMLLVDACTLVLLVAVTHPASSLRHRLGAPWLAAIGRRSYSLYLWHWPVIVFTRPGVDWGLEGTTALLVRLVLIVGLAEISYRFVEQPFRDGRTRRLAAAVTRRIGTIPARRLALASSLVGLVVFVAFLATPTTARTVETARAPAGPDQERAPVTIPTSGPSSDPASGPTTTAAPADPPVAGDQPADATEPPTTTVPAGTPEVTVVGESVTLGAAPTLQGHWDRRVQIDAVEARSASDGIELIEYLATAGRLTPSLMVHIGNNGALPAGGLERILAAAGPDRQVVFVTVRVPRRWEQQVNDEIRRVAGGHDNVIVADWHAIANTEEGLLIADGVHLTPAGRQRYSEMLIGYRP